jgi:hypothetical protein
MTAAMGKTVTLQTRSCPTIVEIEAGEHKISKNFSEVLIVEHLEVTQLPNSRTF